MASPSPLLPHQSYSAAPAGAAAAGAVAAARWQKLGEVVPLIWEAAWCYSPEEMPLLPQSHVAPAASVSELRATAARVPEFALALVVALELSALGRARVFELELALVLSPALPLELELELPLAERASSRGLGPVPVSGHDGKP